MGVSIQGNLSLINNGSSESSDLSLAPGKYYFIVVSGDGSPFNVLCLAKY